MTKLLTLLLLAIPCFAVTDSITLRNNNGSAVSNYPLQFGRIFARAEISQYPQMGLCTDSTCASVSSWLTTQANVQVAWDDGSVRHAILSVVIPSVPAGSTYYTFRSQSSCNCGTGLTRAQMLDPAYNFDAAITATHGTTRTASARQILTDWDGLSTSPVKYWLPGTVSSTVILGDFTAAHTYDFGWQATSDVIFSQAVAATDTKIFLSSTAGITAPGYATLYIPNSTGYGSWLADEDVYICAVDTVANTVTVGNVGCTTVPSTTGRGLHNTGSRTFTTTTGHFHAWNNWQDPASGAYKSIKPIFEATFWPATHQVWVREITEIADTTRLQDQVFDLTMTLGSSNPATLYSKSGMIQRMQERFTKTGWIGGIPPVIEIVHNIGYWASTGSFWNYDPNHSPSSTYVNGLLTAYNAAPHTDCGDKGSLTYFGMGSTGGRPEIAPEDGWLVIWMYSGLDAARTVAFGNADLASCGFPLHLREGDSTKYYDRALTTSGIGRPISRTSHKTISLSSGFAYGSTLTADRVMPVGPESQGPWNYDNEHLYSLHMPLYLTTGDYFYLEEAMFYMSTACASLNGAAVPPSTGGTGPTGAECFAGGSLRNEAWYNRAAAQLTTWIPDAMSTEKSFYSNYLRDMLAPVEAVLGQGNSYPADSVWTTMYNYGLNYIVNKPGFKFAGGNHPLHAFRVFEGSGSAHPGEFAQANYCIDTTYTDQAFSLFEHNYLMLVMGHMKDLGVFPVSIKKLVDWVAPFYIGMATNPGYNPFLMASGRFPGVHSDRVTPISTWAEAELGFWQTKALADANCGGATEEIWGQMTSWSSVNAMSYTPSYDLLTIDALSMVVDHTGGAVAWSWAWGQEQALAYRYSPNLNNAPYYALIPRNVESLSTVPSRVSGNATFGGAVVVR